MSAIVRETSEYVEMSDSITLCIVKDGAAGKDAVTYGVQVTPTYEVWSDAKKHAGIVLVFTKTTGSTMLKYLNVQALGTAKLYVDGTELEGLNKWVNGGSNKIIFDSFTFDGTNNTPTIGTASVITVELLVGDTVVATANYSNGKQGDGVVMAYKHADTQPDVPTGTDPESPGDGWSLSPDAATAGEKVTDVRYGGYESGTYDDDDNNITDATAKEWAEAEDDGRTWMKSPSGLSDYGYAMMKVSFTTQYDNTTVDVEIKAYSEQNIDLVEVWALDTTPSTGTSFRGQGLAHASGNGVEQAYSFTVAKAGRHFICVTYAKDISVDDNGDYGLFRLDLSDIEVAVSDTVWMSQAKVSGGKCVLPWSTPVKINGADGIGAFEILCDPETIVLDTDENGLVSGLPNTNARAALMCVRDGKEVSGVTYEINKKDKNSTVNCDATVNNNGIVTITSVTSQSVTIDGSTVTVSSTSGSVTVSVTENATGVTYTKTVPFTVNVARYTGGLKADNKKLQSQYSQLTNNGSVTDLVQYKSEILQTAKEISLKVSEKSVGRRNMLVGSACRKYGDGFKYMTGQYYDGYPTEQIEINSGIDGVNCIHCRTKRTGTDIYLLSGFSWNGISPQGNIKLEKGKNYVLSFYAKTPTPNYIDFIAEVLYQGSKIDTSRPAEYAGPAGHSSSFSASEANKWELFTVKISVPSNAKYEYEEINIFARSKVDDFVDGYICKPMLEEGEEYNGWTLSEQDYDYVGGNLLDNAGTLTKTGNVETLDENTVTQGGYNNESASVGATLSPTAANNDFLQYSTTGMGLKAGEDYTLSFYARSPGKGILECYLYPSTGYVMTESSHEKIDGVWNPSNGDLRTPIAPTTEWKRYWVHWRPTVNDPQHVLFRLQRPGTNKGSYNSSTSYNVGDVVLYGGTYYRCIKAGQGNTPSSSSSYWEASWFSIEIARPKLEVGATMTEWTEKRADMVDKQALYATGIDIKNRKIIATADNFVVQNNSGTPTFSVDVDGNIVGLGGASFNGPMKATTFTLNSTYFSVMEDGTITATGGRISFFNFDEEGMASGVVLVSDSSQNKKAQQGLGLSLSNISVSGSGNQRISSVFLGNGRIDSRFAGLDDNHTVYRVGPYPLASTFYNYIKLEKLGNGSDSLENNPEHAALGIETQGDFCLAALGGPSLFTGMCFASNTGGSFAADKMHTFYLCSGGTFTMPSNPPDGMLIVVIQTGSRIDFNGNGHRFQSGTYNSLSFTSDSAGQWSLFYYNNNVWYTIYMTR